MSVGLTYSRTHSWANDLNDLERTSADEGEQNSKAFTIQEVDNTVEQGSLAISINLPLPTFPHVENLVITGEGYLKKITDKMDPYRTTGKTSYEISGLSIKGTLNF